MCNLAVLLYNLPIVCIHTSLSESAGMIDHLLEDLLLSCCGGDCGVSPRVLVDWRLREGTCGRIFCSRRRNESLRLGGLG